MAGNLYEGGTGSLRYNGNKTGVFQGSGYRLAVKRISCSSKGPGFNAQYSRGSSQLSVRLFLENPTPPHRNTCGQNSNAYEIKVSLKNDKEHKFSCNRALVG